MLMCYQSKFKACLLKSPLVPHVESWHLRGFCFLLGDGGNDVSMIQEADCGVGVEGRVRLGPFDRPAAVPLSQARFLLRSLSWAETRTQMIPLYGQLLFYVEEAKMTGCFWAGVNAGVSQQLPSAWSPCHAGTGRELRPSTEQQSSSSSWRPSVFKMGPFHSPTEWCVFNPPLSISWWSVSVVSSPLSVFSCLSGRKAGRFGCGLLGDSVQTFGPFADGPRSKQLQALGSPQPICHPQEPVHQRHAGNTDTPPLAPCLSFALKFHRQITPFSDSVCRRKAAIWRKMWPQNAVLPWKDSWKLCVRETRLRNEESLYSYTT